MAHKEEVFELYDRYSNSCGSLLLTNDNYVQLLDKNNRKLIKNVDIVSYIIEHNKNNLVYYYILLGLIHAEVRRDFILDLFRKNCKYDEKVNINTSKFIESFYAKVFKEKVNKEKTTKSKPNGDADADEDAANPEAPAKKPVKKSSKKPVKSDPDAVKPDAVKPDAVKPDAVKPDAKPDVDAKKPVKKSSKKPDVKPDAKPDAVKPDAKPDAVKPDADLEPKAAELVFNDEDFNDDDNGSTVSLDEEDMPLHRCSDSEEETDTESNIV